VKRARWPEVARVVTEMIASGKLAPGATAPSATFLEDMTGVHRSTCRRALLRLVRDGVLDPPASRSGMPRVPGGGGPGPAERALSAMLARTRRAIGLTQEQLALAAGLSVTTVGHAETGRLYHTPATWARLDAALGAEGRLVRAHAAWQAGLDICGPQGLGVAGGVLRTKERRWGTV
jgi:DNA-binding transcriptional MocR family regulator